MVFCHAKMRSGFASTIQIQILQRLLLLNQLNSDQIHQNSFSFAWAIKSSRAFLLQGNAIVYCDNKPFEFV